MRYLVLFLFPIFLLSSCEQDNGDGRNAFRIIVLDGISHNREPGAYVKLNRIIDKYPNVVTKATGLTDTNGIITFKNLPDGFYTYEIAKDCKSYDFNSDEIVYYRQGSGVFPALFIFGHGQLDVTNTSTDNYAITRIADSTVVINGNVKKEINLRARKYTLSWSKFDTATKNFILPIKDTIIDIFCNTRNELKIPY